MGQTTVVGGDLFQWDSGRRLSLPAEAVWVDYRIAGIPGCLRVPAENGEAAIPDLVLTRCGRLTVMPAGEDRTLLAEDHFITGREKPADYVYSDGDLINWKWIREHALAAVQPHASAAESAAEEALASLASARAHAEAAEHSAQTAAECAERTEINSRTAYEIAVKNGFSGTEAQWLASLKGEKGDRGIQGIQGIQGETGPRGAAFTYSDFTAEQLAALKGPKGDTGDRGETGPSGAAFTYSDFTQDQLAALKGEKGDKGDKGDPGDVSDVKINNVSIVSGGTANIPVASGSAYGAVKTASAKGTYVVSGVLAVYGALESDISARNANQRPVIPSNLDIAVRYAMCDGRGAAWTDEEKAAAQNRIGIGDLIDAKLGDLDTAVTGLESIAGTGDSE